MRRLTLDLLALLRSWRGDRLPVAAAVLALALGFGAGGIVLSLVDRLLLTPAPYDEADRLVYMESMSAETATDGRVSMADFLDWRDHSEALSELAVFREYSFTLLTAESEPEELHAVLTSPALFNVLRREALLGRTLIAEEEVPGKDTVVLLEYGLWQRRFEGNPGVLGQSLNLGGQPHMVVGVMPEGFHFPDRATQLWSPLAFNAEIRQGLRRDRRVMQALGRLKDGVSLEQAQGDFERLSTLLAQEHPATNTGWNTRLVPMRERHFAPYRNLLRILIIASAAVLLIAVLDVVHLLLARADARRLDMSVRQALGAGPLEEVRFAVLEGVALALVAIGPGLVFAVAGLRLMAALAAPELTLFQGALQGPPGGLAIGLLIAVGLLCGVLVGLLAAAQSGWRKSSEGIGGRAAVGRSRGSWGGLLITSEVAVALLLLIGAGLLSRSFARLEAVDPGFETDGVVAVQLFLSQTRYGAPPQRAAFYRNLLAQFEATPGVEAALVSTFPMSPVGIKLTARAVPETAVTTGADDPATLAPVPIRVTSPGYYRSLDIPLLDGRAFDGRDHFRSPPVAVINAALARRLWPDGTAVGRKLTLELPRPRSVEVIGIVGNVHQSGLSTAPGGEVYLPFEQFPLPGKTVVLRSELGSERVLEIAKAAIWAVDDQQPIYSAATAHELVQQSLGEHRSGRLGLGLLAALALILTLVGIYAMAAQAVGRRITEIGVRLSLGAGPMHLLAVLLRPLLWSTLIGLGLGLLVAAAFSSVLESLLYGVSKADPVTFLIAATGLLIASLLGGLLPAWRALGREPMAALQRP